jgi:pheromone shutdown-related protein TraB
MNIHIIGTSHIAKQSVDEIEKAIDQDKPDIIAVELDIGRAQALMQNQKSKTPLSEIFNIGVKGFLFVKIGQFVQQKLGKMVGMTPGSDMKAALVTAKKNNLKIALIDQPIKITLHNFSKTLTWKERFRFIADIFKGIIMPKKQVEELGLENFNLSTVPKEDIIEKMIEKLKDRYPSVYKSLVSDRNRYMVRKLVKLSKDNPDKKILAVVGAGHKKGMEELFNKFDVVA